MPIQLSSLYAYSVRGITAGRLFRKLVFRSFFPLLVKSKIYSWGGRWVRLGSMVDFHQAAVAVGWLADDLNGAQAIIDDDEEFSMTEIFALWDEDCSLHALPQISATHMHTETDHHNAGGCLNEIDLNNGGVQVNRYIRQRQWHMQTHIFRCGHHCST